MKLNKKFFLLLLFFIALFVGVSCSDEGDGSANGIPQDKTPTPTEAPMAVRVNGEGIQLSEYEAEIKRHQAGVEQSGVAFDPETSKTAVLDFLIEQTLFAQAASENSYILNDGDLQKRLDEFTQSRGGQEGLKTYISENFYTEESFRIAVARDMAVIWMRNFLVDQIQKTAEQVHARQILVRTENEAIGIQRQLEVGTPFKDLAFQYDPLTGGELGWFPRGFLYQPAIEEAAFALQPGQYSGIIATNYGYHIVEVIESDAQHALSADALLAVQHSIIDNWLNDFKAQSVIEIYIN